MAAPDHRKHRRIYEWASSMPVAIFVWRTRRTFSNESHHQKNGAKCHCHKTLIAIHLIDLCALFAVCNRFFFLVSSKPSLYQPFVLCVITPQAEYIWLYSNDFLFLSIILYVCFAREVSPTLSGFGSAFYSSICGYSDVRRCVICWAATRMRSETVIVDLTRGSRVSWAARDRDWCDQFARFTMCGWGFDRFAVDDSCAVEIRLVFLCWLRYIWLEPVCEIGVEFSITFKTIYGYFLWKPNYNCISSKRLYII